MADQESTTGRYDALIWLLMTEYDGKQYTPSDFLLETLKPELDKARGNTVLEVHDSTVYDLTIAKDFSCYWDHFLDTSERFNNSLVIISYTASKYITRDCYLAGLAKLYTCWDTAYVNCAEPGTINSKAFDFIIAPQELPNKLTELIEEQ